jgi:hypothetical protein
MVKGKLSYQDVGDEDGESLSFTVQIKQQTKVLGSYRKREE